MVAIPSPQDPTLAEIDRAIEVRENVGRRGQSLPMGSIGKPCDRALFYHFRWASPTTEWKAQVLKRFTDGHDGEDLQAKRLRLVEGLELWTVDQSTGGQFAVSDIGGHLQGRIDGVVLGLLQAPKTLHIWEHKQVEEKSQRKLESLKQQVGEKNALFAWKPMYWATAQLYMHYTELHRHYMTVASPGGRHTISVRTEYSSLEANKLIERAKRIIEANRTPIKISHDPAWYDCRWCDHHAVCHQRELPQINCRTCLASTPVEGGWRCDRWDIPLSPEQQQAGCRDHLFLPSLIDGEQTDAAEDGAWVEYRMPDGTTWRNEVER